MTDPFVHRSDGPSFTFITFDLEKLLYLQLVCASICGDKWFDYVSPLKMPLTWEKEGGQDD